MSKSIEILNELEKSHGLKNLAQRGLLTPSLLFYRDIYFEVDIFLRMGNKKEEAVRLVCDKINISRVTVYNAIRCMTNE